MVTHTDTRTLFLNTRITLYLYPFLNTISKTRPFEYLRLTSFVVIGALVKVDDMDSINFYFLQKYFHCARKQWRWEANCQRQWKLYHVNNTLGWCWDSIYLQNKSAIFFSSRSSIRKCGFIPCKTTIYEIAKTHNSSLSSNFLKSKGMGRIQELIVWYSTWCNL